MSQHKYDALSPDDVARLDNTDENVKKLRSIITNDAGNDLVFLPRSALYAIGYAIGYNGNYPQWLIDALMAGMPGEVMFQNQAGWKKGTIKLEFNFYPDAEDTDSLRSPLDDL